MEPAKINWEVLFELSACRAAYKVTTINSEYYVYNHEGVYFSLFLTKKDLRNYLEGVEFVRVGSFGSEEEVDNAIRDIESSTFVLFGLKACEAVDLGRAIPQNANYNLKKYTIGSINVNQIISDAIGWEDYTILTSEQYYKLKQQAE